MQIQHRSQIAVIVLVARAARAQGPRRSAASIRRVAQIGGDGVRQAAAQVDAFFW
jgi:hypothetical protein